MHEKKNKKYFLNLENSNKTKSSVRKILTRAGVLTGDPKKIKNELELYYSNVYDGQNLCRHANYFLVYKWSHLFSIFSGGEEERLRGYPCVWWMLHVLQTFQKNLIAGERWFNSLTVEFFLAFWPLFRKLVVDSLDYAFEYSKLSNSQKQAVITLIEKKGKDKRLVKNWRPISLRNVDAKLASKTLAKCL